MAIGRNRRLANTGLLVGLMLLLAYSAVAVLGKGFNFDNQIQLAAKRYGSHGQQTLEQWRNLLRSLENSDRNEQTKQVNTFVNGHVVFTEDSVAWGQSDYWATPLESMGRGVGDCEDYAIAKYFSLLILGIPADHLRITYVRARIGGPLSSVYEAHMVLAYYPSVDAEPLILDNLIDEIRPGSRRPDLTPIFSFNSDGLWIGTSPGTPSSGSSTSRLSHWRDLIARMHADGFE